MSKGAKLFVVVMVVGAFASASIGCSDSKTPTGPRTPQTGVVPTFAEESSLTQPPVPAQLAAVRGATAGFHSIDQANAAGYVIPPGEPCIAAPQGAMGVHAPNLALMGDQVLDPLKPELLLYEPQSNGGFKLVGVEYFQAVLLRNRATGAVAPRLEQDPWNPAEYEVVTPTPSLFGETFDGPMPGHIPTMPWHWDLHVWIWAPNPSGMFAEWNPSLRCP
jgi:hypothetical protein